MKPESPGIIMPLTLINPQKKINSVFLFSSIGSEKLINNPKISPEIIVIKELKFQIFKF